jgi:hypothetical protein
MANAFGNAIATKVGITPVTVYSVPEAATYCAITLSVLVTNLTGGRLPVNLQLVNPLRVDQPYIVNEFRVEGNDTVDLIKATRIVIRPNESLRLWTTTEQSLDCVVSYVVEADL